MPHPTGPEALPFVQTSIARDMLAKLRVTHEEQGIAVFSGPWGIGKTTALDAFAAEQAGQCVIVKVEPGSDKKGISPSMTAKLVLERTKLSFEGEGHGPRKLDCSLWACRNMIWNYLRQRVEPVDFRRGREAQKPFTYLFDEAQNLSREAIDMLRFWNDHDRTTTPFPVGLVFVGNNEFVLSEGEAGESVLSGAVRSRALYIDLLDYDDLGDDDLILFAQSRGVQDAGALRVVVEAFRKPRVKRDLRQLERLLAIVRRRAGDAPATAEVVRSVLAPA